LTAAVLQKGISLRLVFAPAMQFCSALILLNMARSKSGLRSGVFFLRYSVGRANDVLLEGRRD